MKLDGLLYRGLAASAVGALTITGTTVNAPAARATDGVSIRLISQLDHVIATRPDGSLFKAEVRLVAKAPDGWFVDFQVNPDPRAGAEDPGWTSIKGTKTRRGGYVSMPWSPTEQAPGLVGHTVGIRAVRDERVLAAPTYSATQQVFIAPPHADTDAVFIEEFTGGYFVQPYASTGRTASLVGIAGTTSATGGAVSLEAWRPRETAYRGLTNAAVSPADLKGARGQEFFEVAGGRFDVVLPLTAFDAEAGEAVAVRARRGTDDVAIGALAEQQIGGIVARNVKTTSAGTTVQLEVFADDAGVVAGAEVRRADGSLLGYTGGAGLITVTQPNATTETYYVNTDDGDAFDPSIDYSTENAVPAFTRAPTTMIPVLADGTAFDAREYAAGDVALQVVDQDGKPFAGAREVRYRLYPSGATAPALTTATTDANGRLVLPFDPSRSSGTWLLEHGIYPDTALFRWDRFVSGQAALTLTPGRGQAASGGQLSYSGRLTVAGRPLSGRTVDLAYRRGAELVPGTGADAGILVGGTRQLSATVTTGADGTFSVRIGDAREKGGPTEQGGRLTATARVSGATATATSQFGTGKGTVRPVLRGSSRGGTDRLVVRTSTAVAGERVRILAKVGRKWKAVKTARLDRRGGATVAVKDRNDGKVTTYVAQLLPSARVAGSRSTAKRVR